MTDRKTKLELTWIGKDERPRLEPRILLEDPALSHVAPHRVSDTDIFDNILIHGDNLLALKALEQQFAGKVKCVYIDPPYNTGSAFAQYDDGLEHSLWLGLIRDRVESIRNLLSEDGSVWVSIDDNECHYLKIVMDEIFGRENFITSFIWRKVDSPHDNKVPIAADHEYILCYTKNKRACVFRPQSNSSILDAYKPPDEESPRAYRDRLLKKNGKSSLRTDRPSMYFAIQAPDGTDVFPLHDDGREARWAHGKASVDRMVEAGTLVWKKRGSSWVPYTREYAPETPTRPYPTIWSDLHTTRQAKAHQKELLGQDNIFATPKAEPLIERIIQISTNQGDLVLDSFLGSGTTAAVAHKMGRRWIGIELGDHAVTHCVPRLVKVIDGEDPGGITESAAWKGGGGFRFFRLAPSLLEKDKWGNWVVSKRYNGPMLAEAVCKLEGFRYEPDADVFWIHGRGTETSFLYATDQTLTAVHLLELSTLVGPESSLTVCCAAWRGDADEFPNLTMKKIPQAVFAKCEWGRDDYSLNVAELTPAAPTREKAGAKPKKQKSVQELPLFGGIDNGDES